ncbi:MAG: twin-arginine translocation signal domain-containing protein, partial [Methylobacteriaceae bacterium]|nr:twin-arginine translocation signal domain-containing protein [Methylobacteriaceae bacterium]
MEDLAHPTRRDVVKGGLAAAGVAAITSPIGRVFAAEGGTTVSGFVFEDAGGTGKRSAGERGIAGVTVSNGRDVAMTDAEGRYELPIEEAAIIFVIKPTGYAPP